MTVIGSQGGSALVADVAGVYCILYRSPDDRLGLGELLAPPALLQTSLTPGADEEDHAENQRVAGPAPRVDGQTAAAIIIIIRRC